MLFSTIDPIFKIAPLIIYGVVFITCAYKFSPLIALGDPTFIANVVLIATSSLVLALMPFLILPIGGELLNVSPHFFLEHISEFGNLHEIMRLASSFLKESHGQGQLITSIDLFLALKKSIILSCNLSESEADPVARQLANVVIYIFDKKA